MADPSEILKQVTDAFTEDMKRLGNRSGSTENLESRIIAVENKNDFDTIMNQFPNNVICVDFMAKWYPPSQHFLTNYHAISEEYKGAVFCIVDIDEAKDVASDQKVTAPMFRVYKSKRVLAELAGVNVLGNTNDLTQVLRYELEAAGAKTSDPPIDVNSIVPKHAPLILETKKEDKTPKSSQSKTTFTSFPKSDLLLFESGDYSKITAKIFQFDDELISTPSKLTDKDRTHINQIVSILTQVPPNPNSVFDSAQIETMLKIMQWPQDKLFPVLDLFRLMILHPDAVAHFSTKQTALASLITQLNSSAPYANQLCATRAIANLFRYPHNKTFLLSSFPSIVQNLNTIIQTDNKNLQISLSSLLFNYAVLFSLSKDVVNATKLVNLVAKELEVPQSEDALHRIIVALGTLAWNNTIELEEEILNKLSGQGISSENVKLARDELLRFARQGR